MPWFVSPSSIDTSTHACTSPRTLQTVGIYVFTTHEDHQRNTTDGSSYLRGCQLTLVYLIQLRVLLAFSCDAEYIRSLPPLPWITTWRDNLEYSSASSPQDSTFAVMNQSNAITTSRTPISKQKSYMSATPTLLCYVCSSVAKTSPLNFTPVSPIIDLLSSPKSSSELTALNWPNLAYVRAIQYC